MLFELLYIRIFMLVIDVLFETNKRKDREIENTSPLSSQSNRCQGAAI